MKRIRVKVLFIILVVCLVLSACSVSQSGISGVTAGDDHESETIPVSSTQTAIPSETATSTLTNTPTFTPTFTATLTFTPTYTATITPVPTYVLLRAKVLEQANCRYGPGVAYLYKYGLYPESNIEVIGRNELGTFAYIQAIGGDNPCWVSASVLDIKGDIMNTEPTTSVLPFSQYYGPPDSVHAKREGDQVIISWTPVNMTEDKYRGYLIEAWLCQDGQLIFTPVRSDETILNLIDEKGCAEPSSGRIYTAEKHGYSQWKTIAWPAYDNETEVTKTPVE